MCKRTLKSLGVSVGLSNGATATVLEIANGVVKIDARHALAGTELTLERSRRVPGAGGCQRC